MIETRFPPEAMLLPERLLPSLAEQDLRILVGCPLPHFFGDYYDPDRIKFFALRDDVGDVPFSVAEESFLDVVARLPEGWEPDYVLFLHPEYLAIPRDMDQCPYPLVGLVGDWNLGMRDMWRTLGIFDLLVGDMGFVEMAGAAGLGPAHYWPLYSFDQARDWSRDTEKRHDVTFIGNLNPSIHRARNRMLTRLATMSERYRVNIVSGVWGPAYGDCLRDSKIVFNHSVRSELNLRCYEAPACGALMFIEASNREARHLLRDRVDCVYYTEDDMEELLDYYLSHDEEREAIARSGEQRVRRSSYTAHFSGLLELLRDFFSRPNGDRPFRALPERERLLALARKAYRSSLSSMRHPYIERLLLEALAPDPQDLTVMADMMALYACWAAAAEGPRADMLIEKALSYCQVGLERALELDADLPVFYLNAALLLILHRPEAFKVIDHCLNKVFFTDAAAVEGLVFPLAFDRLAVELDRAFSADLAAGDSGMSRAQAVLRWRAAELLGDLQQEPARKAHWYRIAAELRPDIAETQTKLGQLMAAQGRWAEAVVCLERANHENPFDFQAADLLGTAYEQTHQPDRAQAHRTRYDDVNRIFRNF